MTFLNLQFLPWLCILGIPILIHLLTRRTRRAMVLPTFRFVRKSLAQQSQIFRFRRLLLLAARLLLLLFLVLTFLKPTLPAPLAERNGEKHAVVIVLDASLSMGYLQNGATSLTRLRNQVGSVLDGLHTGDVANVILVSAESHPVLPKLGNDFGQLQQAVKTAQPTQERGEIAGAVALATEQLAAVSAAHKTLILASDYQRTNWAEVKFDALPSEVNLVFLNSDSEERENAAITGLKMRPATPRAGEDATVVAEVWNGSRAARSLQVSLDLQRDDTADSPAEPPAPQVATIPPYASGTVTFPVHFAEAGRYRITARLPADNLPADDARFLVADLRHSLTALLLTNSPMNGRSGAYFLARALNPTPLQPGGVRVIPRQPTALTENDLKACDAVLLDEVTTFPADRLPLLMRYVSDGGALIVFLSDLNSVGQMQALATLSKPGEGPPFLPTTSYNARGHGKGYVTLTEARYDSPLLRIFKDPGSADLGAIHFTRFFQTSEPDQHAEILLRFEDNTPAAARRDIGAGSILVCNFSPSLADSDLARQEVFPPLMHEFLNGMTGKEGDKREFNPGGIASVTLDAGDATGQVKAFGPNGLQEAASADQTSGGVIIEHAAGLGFHAISANGRRVSAIAVNPHPDESDLRALDPHELEGRRSTRSSITVNTGQDSAAQLEDLQRSRPLWPYCLLAALFFLLLEHAIATFGNHARVRPRPGKETAR